MKVILLRDVAKIGRRGEVVDLPNGYAQNQLIPKKWAEPATPANLKKIASVKAASSATAEGAQARFDTAVAALTATPLQVVVNEANNQGHLFKAVHEQDIEAAAKLAGIMLERSDIVIDTQIKSLGAHSVTLKHAGKKTQCTIEVIKKS